MRNRSIYDFLRKKGPDVEVMKIILVAIFHVDLSKRSLQLLAFFRYHPLTKRDALHENSNFAIDLFGQFCD